MQPLPTVEATGWNPLNTAVGAFNLLMRGVQFLIDAVIVILIVGTPLALVIGIPLAVVRARRPRSTPRSETPPAG